jgi:putative transposase
MPRRELFTNTFYHIYNRSIEKQSIFFAPKDLERFFYKLELLQEKFPTIKIFAYCVLPNHFHFLVQDVQKDINPGVDVQLPSKNISSFFSILLNSYVKYFNQKYNRTGGLFGNRFKTRTVEDNDYFHQLKYYIEWNAVKHEIVNTPEEWAYSSYSSQSTPGLILDIEKFEPYFE